MRLISYDCEVFAYDWLVTLKDKETGVYIKAGFTEEQAWKLTEIVFTNSTKKGIF